MNNHINNIRTVRYVKKERLRNLIPYSPHSFGVFGGWPEQRNRIALLELSRFCGQMGCVLIHDDPLLENELGSIYSLSRNRSFNIVLANSGQKFYYDPLYGLNDSDVKIALFPNAGDTYLTPELQLRQNSLSDYLRVMEYQFRLISKKPRNPFGAFPYSLDMLLKLVEMDSMTFKSSVLDYLPNQFSDLIWKRLSRSDVQQQANATVSSFADSLKNRIWMPSDPGRHTRVSIVSQVRSHNLISIYISPNGRQKVLDYLTVELNALSSMREPFLLVTSGIGLNESIPFQNLFIGGHQGKPYYTGILSGNLYNVAQEEHFSRIFNETQELFVFSMSDAESARPFSEATGKYYRIVNEKSTSRSREPFALFSSHGTANNQRETEQSLITPDELMRLGSGCVLTGRDHSIPTIYENLEI